MKTGRNDPCPCGSGKKYKHCCLSPTSALKDEFHKLIAEQEFDSIELFQEASTVAGLCTTKHNNA